MFIMKIQENWFVKVILFPFVITRGLLIFAGMFATYILPSNVYQTENSINNGWLFSSQRIIEMWARWDSGWYLSIINIGYSMGKDVYTSSNLAFFPVYPYLVKILSFLVPIRPTTDEIIIAVGVILSNLMLIGSLVLIYKISIYFFKNEAIAKNTVWYLLVFPSSFFLSSFYTESTFLFFSLISYWAAINRKWWLACIMASVLTATRSIGLIIALPLFVEYLKSKDYNFKKFDFSILWFAVIPLGIFSFFYYMKTITGDFLAAVKVQEAWGRKMTDPISSLLFPTGFWVYITPLDQFFAISTLVTAFAMIRDRLKVLNPLGFYSILLIIPTLFTGTLDSLSRFIVVIFPLFIYWSYLITGSKKFDLIVKIIFMSIQVIFFGLFSQFYWVG